MKVYEFVNEEGFNVPKYLTQLLKYFFCYFCYLKVFGEYKLFKQIKDHIANYRLLWQKDKRAFEIKTYRQTIS